MFKSVQTGGLRAHRYVNIFHKYKKITVTFYKKVLAPCSFGLNNFGDLPNENIPVQKAYLFHSRILKETLLFCSG